MIYGTHNSLSYAEPTKWWMKLINFTAKCQDMTIEEQWDYGVRFFDIRIKDYNNNAWHGLVEYDMTVIRALTYLNYRAREKGETCYIYLNFEESITSDMCGKMSRYKLMIKNLSEIYESLTICGGYCKGPWRKVLLDINNPEINELYWEFMNYNSPKYLSKWKKFKKLLTNIIHFSPKYWAKRDNKEYKRIAKENNLDIVVLDFVDYGDE